MKRIITNPSSSSSILKWTWVTSANSFIAFYSSASLAAFYLCDSWDSLISFFLVTKFSLSRSIIPASSILAVIRPFASKPELASIYPFISGALNLAPDNLSAVLMLSRVSAVSSSSFIPKEAATSVTALCKSVVDGTWGFRKSTRLYPKFYTLWLTKSFN